MSDRRSDIESSLALKLRADEFIWSIDGRRRMVYQSLAHDMDNLLHSLEAQRIVQYDGNESFIYHFGLFGNFSFLAYRICHIFWKIRKDLPDQQEDILNFLFWLLDMFLPFLARAEQFIPNIRREVDEYLQERDVPTVENLVRMFQNHFVAEAAIILRCILATRVDRVRTRFSVARPVIGPAIAKLQGFHCETSQAMATRVGMTIENLRLFLFNLENFSQIQGKAFYGSLLTMSVAKNILIKKLTNGENPHVMFLLLMRILRRN
jgi:hypothetical protein